MTTDHGDASGTGYYSPARREWLPDVADWALGRGPGTRRSRCRALPRRQSRRAHRRPALRWPPAPATTWPRQSGLGLGPGDVAVSIGTSGTAFCVTDMPTADPSGSVAGFCRRHRALPAAGRTVNAARVLAVVGELLGVDHDEFAELALSAASGAGGLTFLPYLDGERTPEPAEARPG